MNNNQEFFINEKTENSELENEIDLKKLFYSFMRNKRLIGIFGLIGLFFSGVGAFNTKRVWQGEFQIVLESSKQAPSTFNEQIAKIAGMETSLNTLGTEVGILKSPSVLMNVFEFVKTEKELKGNSAIKGLRFRNWKNDSLDITLEKGTTILNLAYKDTEKDLILPVLNMISYKYQRFSENKRIRSLDLGLNYFQKQINIYKNKSIESLRKAQKFAIDNDLSIRQDESTIDLNRSNQINIETIRVQAANQIRVIDQRLEQIDNLSNQSDEQIVYAASTIPELSDLTAQLKVIDTELTRKRVIYKEDDILIQKMIEERIFLIDLLKKQVKGFLNAKRTDALARMRAAERPEGVLIEYKMLLSNALKDQATLDKLENQNRVLLLEKARKEDPWKLITNPTLLPYPVAPKRKRILALGLISGLFLGSGAALISEKRKNIIYSISEFETLGKWPFLVELDGSQKSYWAETLDLLVSGQLLDIQGSLAFVSIGEINDSLLQELYRSLKEFFKDREIIVTKDLKKSNEFMNLILLTANGITKRDEFIDINKKLLLKKKPVLGLLTLSNIDLKI